MRSTLKAALLAAVPLEIVNFWVIGYPTAGGSLTMASQNAGIALEWDLLHLPGLIASDRILFLREHARALLPSSFSSPDTSTPPSCSPPSSGAFDWCSAPSASYPPP